MARVGFLGLWSIDNAGDPILGYATRQALRALVPGAEQIAYAPETPHALGHAWDRERGIDTELVRVPASTDLGWARGLDALIIGGGGILQLDPAFRPFLLGDPTKWPAEQPAAWNVICSQNTPWYLQEDLGGYEAILRCCEKLRYVSVRNQTTLRFVRRLGFDGEVHVVPDPALLLDVPAEVDASVDEILRRNGVQPGRVLLGATLGTTLLDPRAGAFYRELFATLARLARDTPAEIVLIPWSYVRDDEKLQELAARHLPGATIIRGRLRPLELWRLVGRMSFYIASRYHATLAAFAQNVPFLTLDENLSDFVASSKTREVIVDNGLEPSYLVPVLSTGPAFKLEGMFAARDRVSHLGALADCRRKLREHYVRMVRALGLVA